MAVCLGKNEIIHTVLCIILTLPLVKTKERVCKKPPEIRLNRYYQSGTSDSTPVAHDSQFLIKRESHITTAEVTCEAEYPIAWKFPYPENAKGLAREGGMDSNYRISNWTNPELMPVNTKFRRVIKIPFSSLGFLSLNITCVDLEQNSNVANPSVHIFWKGWDSFSLESARRKLRIYANPDNNSSLVLPCRPAYPYLKVVLERKTEIGEWISFNSTENHIIFDPKIGFIFQIITKNSFGWYKCSPAERDVGVSLERWVAQFVLIEILERTGSSGHQDYNFVPRSILHGKATAGIKHDFRMQAIKCCTGIKNKRPKTYVKMCMSTFEAQVARDSILEDIETNTANELTKLHSNECNQEYAISDLISIIVVCRGENVEFVDEFSNVFLAEANGPVVNRSSRILKERFVGQSLPRQNWVTATNQFMGSAELNAATTSIKLMLVILRNARNANEIPRNNGDYKYFCEKLSIPNLSQNTKKIDNTHLFEYDRDFYYEGENLIFMCLGGKLLYANGAYLRLTWKNGTKTILTPTKKDYSTIPCPNNVGVGGFVHLSENTYISYRDSTAESKFGSVIANHEINSVQCWMPQAKTDGWDMISKSLRILPGGTQ